MVDNLKTNCGVMLARQMTSASQSMESEESLDFAQALNTALCFLCWVNADVAVADEFLTQWPESLLLEGSHQDCASCIVKQRMRHCRCRNLACNRNRENLLDLMGKGFQYYQNRHMDNLLKDGAARQQMEASRMADLKSTTVFPKLMATSRYLRNLSVEETAVHGQCVEAHVVKVLLEQQLQEAKTTAKRSRVRSLFTCGSDRVKSKEARVARLEHEAHMAELKLASVEKEHKLLVNAIDQGHRSQYALLKRVFEGCARHQCHGMADSRVVDD